MTLQEHGTVQHKYIDELEGAYIDCFFHYS